MVVDHDARSQDVLKVHSLVDCVDLMEEAKNASPQDVLKVHYSVDCVMPMEEAKNARLKVVRIK